MNRIDRLNAILIHLQSKKVVTAQEIAERFEISIRTVYRDIRALEEAGVPIGAEAGIGYFIQENYHLPPVMFTNDEATSILFGAKFVEQFSDDKLNKAFQSALYKIKSVLKTSEKDYINELDNYISVFNYTYSEKKEDSNYLSQIKEALVNKNMIEIDYHARYSNELSTRLIEPIGIIYYGNGWHLIAYCHKRSDYRDFKVDRIKTLKVQNQKITLKHHLKLDEYFEKIFNPEDMPKIVLLCKKESERFIRDSKYWYGFTHQEDYDEIFYKMYFRNSDLFGFSRWVILGGSQVVVQQPEELKTIVTNFAHEIAAHYKK